MAATVSAVGSGRRPQLVDIGVNLLHKSFRKDLAAVVKRAHAAGVTRLVLTGCDMRGSTAAAAYASAAAPGTAFSTAGFHPHDAKHFKAARDLPKLRALLAQPAVVAVGECGLDFNRNFSPPVVQEEAFKAHIRLAIELGMPMFVHEREAGDRLMACFDAVAAEGSAPLPPVVVHCFTSTRDDLRRYLKRGFFIGLTGTLCKFERGKHIRALVPEIPMDRLLLETDAPFMSPIKKLRRCEPMHCVQVCEAVAKCYGETYETVAAATTANAIRFFRLDAVGTGSADESKSNAAALPPSAPAGPASAPPSSSGAGPRRRRGGGRGRLQGAWAGGSPAGPRAGKPRQPPAPPAHPAAGTGRSLSTAATAATVAAGIAPPALPASTTTAGAGSGGGGAGAGGAGAGSGTGTGATPAAKAATASGNAGSGKREYVDTHCHLDTVLERLKLRKFADLRKKCPAGLAGVVAIFCDPAAFSPSFGVWPDMLAQDGVYGAFGLHPHSAKFYTPALAERIAACLAHDKAIAYGEIGLDYHYNHSPQDVQRRVFEEQLRVGVSSGLPIVVHIRKAEADALRIMQKALPATHRVHVHCYTGDSKWAASFLKAFPNLYFGFTGFITFDSAGTTRAALRDVVPLERLVLETDGPHMLPNTVGGDRGGGRGTGRGRGRGGRGGGGGGGRGRGRGGRGRRRGKGGVCHPGHVVAVAEAVAKVKRVTTDAVLTAARQNTRELYGI